NLKTTTMFTVLFILSILIFGYLMYVLVRPEQF
ncbi:MAG TPA: potassium-transporting ATPase subunit F, partial [Candidatus Alistipes pullistercoris]|nr:potassium-transporting ATPase subunit F [Candidatus Alistipes pullistercoris]